jgi:hypothetical protein
MMNANQLFAVCTLVNLYLLPSKLLLAPLNGCRNGR